MPLKMTLADLAKDALTRVPEVDCDELVAMCEAREHARPIVIDVREPDERARGYVPGSVFVPRGVLERDIEKAAFGHPASDADLETPIVCYCGGGSRSALAADMLKKMGFSSVYSLEGGFKAWGASGKPVGHDRTG
jgi:rhodanese-related sulfurtransferase